MVKSLAVLGLVVLLPVFGLGIYWLTMVPSGAVPFLNVDPNATGATRD